VPEEKAAELEKQGTRSELVPVAETDPEPEKQETRPEPIIHKTVVQVGQCSEPKAEMLKFFASVRQTRSMPVEAPVKAPVQKQGSLSEEQWTYGDEDYIEYVKGKPFLPHRVLKSMNWEMKSFHDWYLEASSLGVTQIDAKIPKKYSTAQSLLFPYFSTTSTGCSV